MKIFGAHINVQLCSSLKSIKYVAKYINEGSGQAKFSLQSANEVEQFRSGRYIRSSEAIWRIMSSTSRTSTSYFLSVLLENGGVYFIENNTNNVVNNPRDTTLTEFFKLCSKDDFAGGTKLLNNSNGGNKER